MRIAALVLAAGRGERMRSALPKAFVPLAGRTLLARSLAAMACVPEIDLVVPVVAADALERFAALAPERAGIAKLGAAVAGGRERQDSMAAGLAALPPDVGFVAVHDAARPLVRAADVTRVVAAARETGAALLVTPVTDTVKRVRGGLVVETPERSECFAAQTPQVFRLDLLREALAKARAEGVVATDDAQLVERLGGAVRAVEGDPTNRKITRPADLAWAELELARRAAEEAA
ncbi:MAG TPA: 2-C-methyl-D-erythritol 4-phosphate cytidylyltransferase [Myxococcota bacterium]|nr:2-C-methyl-D-erythritol 4-phosphate cytidylyltransferase [Myxococcota bacterium]